VCFVKLLGIIVSFTTVRFCRVSKTFCNFTFDCLTLSILLLYIWRVVCDLSVWCIEREWMWPVNAVSVTTGSMCTCINFTHVELVIYPVFGIFPWTLWRPLLPYEYSYKASCVRPGQAVICNFSHLGILMLSPECQSAHISSYCNWQLNPVWHRMLYSCTHMAVVVVTGLNSWVWHYDVIT